MQMMDGQVSARGALCSRGFDSGFLRCLTARFPAGCSVKTSVSTLPMIKTDRAREMMGDRRGYRGPETLLGTGEKIRGQEDS